MISKTKAKKLIQLATDIPGNLDQILSVMGLSVGTTDIDVLKEINRAAAAAYRKEAELPEAQREWCALISQVRAELVQEFQLYYAMVEARHKQRQLTMTLEEAKEMAVSKKYEWMLQ